MKGKQPIDHVFCSVCGQPYGFINCRYTWKGRNYCLQCAIIEKRRMNPANKIGESATARQEPLLK